MHNILRNNVRILRPVEYKQLLTGIAKTDLKILTQAMLYTGMRYVELKRFQNHPSWFDGGFIHLPKEALFKKRRQVERAVRLNPQGKIIVEYFLKMGRIYSSWQSMAMNLKRWARNARLDSEGISVKTFRKTWESWLFFYYPTRIYDIVSSQGHATSIAIKYYINMPFTEIDKIEMKEYIDGWI